MILEPRSARGQAVPVAVPDQLPATIPIFPLPDVVLFPDVARPLLIFEPRYRAMVADALEADRIIGMVLLQPGFEAEYEGRPPVFPIGCAGIITRYERLEDGRYVIELRGFAKFRVKGEDQSRAYRLASVEALPEVLNGADRAELSRLRLALDTLVARLFPVDADVLALPDEEFVNLLAQNGGFETPDQQRLLELQGPVERALSMIEMLNLRVAPLR